LELEHNATLVSLMTTHYSNVWSYVYMHTKDHHAADDLTQEVFVRAFTGLEEFRNQSNHKTWLYSIARNLCRDFSKSAFVRRVVPTAGGLFESHSNAQRSHVEDEVVQTILSDELWQNIFKLPAHQREVVLLHLKDDLTFREIADIVHAKEVTVRARYRRALAYLRSMFDGGDNDGV
jgi:RNA polymerase sigma-70 factor (ECF subfamily)